MPYLLKKISVKGEDYNVRLIKRRNIKHIAISFNPRNDEVQVSAPIRAKNTEIAAFMQDSHEKINQYLANNIIQKITLSDGVELPILGVKSRLVSHKTAPNSGDDVQNLLITCGKKTYKQAASLKLRQMLLNCCTQHLTQLISHEAFEKIKIEPKISLRNVSSRWGSCHAKTGKIMISNHLIFAPIEVLYSVVAHEAAHLIHPNHSANFWQLLRLIDPNCEASKLWLKNNGNSLFRYQIM